MRINNNIMALNTHRQFSINNDNVSNSTEKLSSGFRINRAGDDAAGLAISEKMRAQIRGLEMAAKNSQDAISLVQTAEGALTETHAILQKMRELAVQSSSDTNETIVDRAALDAVFQELKNEIDDIAEQTKFNEMSLLDGSFGSANVDTAAFLADVNGGLPLADLIGSIDIKGGLEENGGILEGGDKFTFTVGEDETLSISYTNKEGELEETIVEFGSIALDGKERAVTLQKDGLSVTINLNGLDEEDLESAITTAGTDGHILEVSADDKGAKIQTGANKDDTLTISINDMRSDALNIKGAGITTRDDASNAIESVNDAINQVSTQRAKLGAYQNRLEHKIKNLNTSAENLQAAESRIRDLDMAKEMTAFTKNSILVQASTAMLAQANSAPQVVLSLLR